VLGCFWKAIAQTACRVEYAAMFHAAPQPPRTLSEQAPGTMTRRASIRLMAGASLAAGFSPWSYRVTPKAREFHVCLTPQAILEDSEFPATLKGAGVSCVWLAGFFYGYWPWPLASLQTARDRLERAGLETRVVNVPLGAPRRFSRVQGWLFPTHTSFLLATRHHVRWQDLLRHLPACTRHRRKRGGFAESPEIRLYPGLP
jgi:hypothetical protein